VREKKRSITKNATKYIRRECSRKQNKMCLGETMELHKHIEKAGKLKLVRLKMMHMNNWNKTKLCGFSPQAIYTDRNMPIKLYQY
jgi:hypothetical protein